MKGKAVWVVFGIFLMIAGLPPLYAPISDFEAEMYGDSLLREKTRAAHRSPEEVAADVARKRSERNKVIMAKMSRTPVGVAHFDNPPDPQARAYAQRRRQTAVSGVRHGTASTVSVVSSLVGLVAIVALTAHYLFAEHRRRARMERRSIS